MKEKIDWKLVIQIALTVLTAIASAMGITSCIGKIM
ncbi:MAG: smalltalk protein [Prevotellaceae bacterium]|nr:smalltalk protein [Candidatus Minthosoma equi]